MRSPVRAARHHHQRIKTWPDEPALAFGRILRTIWGRAGSTERARRSEFDGPHCSQRGSCQALHPLLPSHHPRNGSHSPAPHHVPTPPSVLCSCHQALPLCPRPQPDAVRSGGLLTGLPLQMRSSSSMRIAVTACSARASSARQLSTPAQHASSARQLSTPLNLRGGGQFRSNCAAWH